MGAKLPTATGVVAVVLAIAGQAQALTLHVQRKLSIRQNVGLHFSAPALPNGGYYYAVVVLRPSARYSALKRPRCSLSSNMERTDYGSPQATGSVALTLTPGGSRTGRWCPGGFYEGAIYAVPHAPPCEAGYPCRSEPYEPPAYRCGPGTGNPCGVVAKPKF